MKSRIVIALSVTLAVVVLAMAVLPTAMPTSPVRAATVTRYEYAVPYHCGWAGSDEYGVKPGNYATTINVHNPNVGTATVLWKVVRTYPTPATKTSFNSLNIQNDQGKVWRCTNIWNRLNMQPGSYVTGFVVLHSFNQPLDVYATYTNEYYDWDPGMGGIGIGLSIDVEHIEATITYVEW